MLKVSVYSLYRYYKTITRNCICHENAIANSSFFSSRQLSQISAEGALIPKWMDRGFNSRKTARLTWKQAVIPLQRNGKTDLRKKTFYLRRRRMTELMLWIFPHIIRCMLYYQNVQSFIEYNVVILVILATACVFYWLPGVCLGHLSGFVAF